MKIKVLGIVMALLFSLQSHAGMVKKQILKTALKHKVCPKLALAVAKVESGLKTPKKLTSNIGIFQIKLASAKEVGFRGTIADLLLPTNNIEFGVRYLKKCQDIYGNDTHRIVCCYNAGWAAKDRICQSKAVLNYYSKVVFNIEHA
jgi:soluble lytic murein transglycosylase-like protein